MGDRQLFLLAILSSISDALAYQCANSPESWENEQLRWVLQRRDPLGCPGRPPGFVVMDSQVIQIDVPWVSSVLAYLVFLEVAPRCHRGWSPWLPWPSPLGPPGPPRYLGPLGGGLKVCLDPQVAVLLGLLVAWDHPVHLDPPDVRVHLAPHLWCLVDLCMIRVLLQWISMYCSC